MGEFKEKLSRINDEAIVFIVFIALFIIFSITLADVGAGFISTNNLMNIIRQTALIAIMAVGMSFVLGAAQIDLSVGSVVGLVSVVSAIVMRHFNVPLGILAGLSLGVIAGSINGFVITKLKVPAFIATLGTMITFAGLSRTITNLRPIPILNDTYNYIFGGGTIGFIPTLLFWMLIVVFIGYLVMTKRSFGRKVLSVGGNPEAAFYSGIKINQIKFKVMVLSSTLAALAGLLWAGRFGGGRYSLGDGAELSVIAATVLGGTSIYGGKATVLGATIGALMIGMINNALILYGFDVYQQQIIRGIVIIGAVAFTSFKED
ncbi:MAG: ABC transporter permease [bacterium]